jgi:thioredoxin-dependent peroxiredoxin
MRRRQLLTDLLQSAGVLAMATLASPRPARAMGGTLPSLDQPAPAFSLEGISAGQDVHLSLADLAGSWLLLYFYPKDFTSGCTLEARGFQRDLVAYKELGAQVVGISADDPDQHASFCGSEGLTYTLLSDPGGRVSQAYGSWIPPFSQRHTFLIDPQGVLRARWTAVRPAAHSQEVLAELKRLQQEG